MTSTSTGYANAHRAHEYSHEMMMRIKGYAALRFEVLGRG